MSSNDGSRRCSATTRAGEPCKAWAVRGGQLCAAHSGKVGAPVGNQNRRTHGFYAAPARKLETIGDVVADQLNRQEQLSTYIDEQMAAGAVDLDEVVKLFALTGQNASRLGRLLRDQRALSGASADGFLEMISKLLDEINTEMDLGVTL